MIHGVTIGDSSGVGPEILLAAFRKRELRHPFVAYGDADALAYYNDTLRYGVPFRQIAGASEYREGALNIIDHGLLRREEVTPGRLNKRSGQAAREYVVSATRAAL